MGTIMSKTATAATGQAVTLTIPDPGGAQRIFVTSIEVVRFLTSPIIVAGGAPVTVSVTGLPDAMSIFFPAEITVQGAEVRRFRDFGDNGIPCNWGAAVSVSCPATGGSIWQITVNYGVS